MKSELGTVDLVGKSETECVLANRCGLGLLSVRQDGGADLFGWWSMVTLLCLWGHAGMERREILGIKHLDMFKLIK